MRSQAASIVSVLALLGFGVSVFLVAQYNLPPSAGACPLQGGCHAVRACWIVGIPPAIWPLLGVLGFGVALGLSLSARRWARAVLRVLSTAMGLVGAALLLLQKARCGAFCPYCVVADVSAVGLAISAWIAWASPVEIARGRRWAFSGLAVAALGGSIAWGVVQSQTPNRAVRLERLPASVTREQHPGTLTVVEFMSFACPHCRAEQVPLREAIAPFASRVRLVRRFPAPDAQSEPATRAFFCAEAQGKGEPMADELVRTERFDREKCEEIAGRLGLELAAFRACVDAPSTTARLAEDRATLEEASLVMLPTIFVGHDRFDGNVGVEPLRESMAAAVR